MYLDNDRIVFMSPASDPMIIKMAVIRGLPEFRVVGPCRLFRTWRYEVLDENLKLTLNLGWGLLIPFNALFWMVTVYRTGISYHKKK